MYHLVMYNISPIQQGIQAYHAGMDYVMKWGESIEFVQWLMHDKTVIILNGGTSNNNRNLEVYGTMQQHLDELNSQNINTGIFYEPDLNDALSAIAFLVPEQVWDKENYPDYPVGEGGDVDAEPYYKWVYLMGGEKNVWLRQFLSQFKLA